MIEHLSIAAFSSNNFIVFKSSVQFSRSVMSDSLRPHGLQHTRPPCPSPTPGAYSNTYSRCHKLTSVMPSNHLILYHPLLLVPSIFPSIRAFSNESALHIRLLKYWSFSFNISLSKEYSRLISFRMDWLDLFAVHGNLKGQNINASALSFLFSPTLISTHDYWKNS